MRLREDVIQIEIKRELDRLIFFFFGSLKLCTCCGPHLAFSAPLPRRIAHRRLGRRPGVFDRGAPGGPAHAAAGAGALGVRLRARRVRLHYRQVLRLRERRLRAQQILRLQRRLRARLQGLRLRGRLRAQVDLRLRGPLRVLKVDQHRRMLKLHGGGIERKRAASREKISRKPLPQWRTASK